MLLSSTPSTKKIQDPVTKEYSRTSAHKFSWVKTLFLYIKNSHIKEKFKKIYISLLLFSARKFLFLFVIFPRTLKAIFLKNFSRKPQENTKNTEKTENHKKKIFQFLSNRFSRWKPEVKTQDEDIRTSNLLMNGLGVQIQDKLCKNWKEDNLWCMTKYKQVRKKVRPVPTHAPVNQFTTPENAIIERSISYSAHPTPARVSTHMESNSGVARRYQFWTRRMAFSRRT
jgi:hypothetical protein